MSRKAFKAALAASTALFIFSFSAAVPAQTLTGPGAPGLTMKETLRYVYENNPALKAADANLQATEELYPQARAGYRPTLTTEATIYSAHITNSNFTQGDGSTTKQATINLDQPLYRGGRTQAETRRAKNLIRSGEAQRMQSRQNTLLEAATAYFDVVRDRDLLALSQQNRERLQQELTAAQARFNGGEITQTDVRQAEARLARAEAEHTIASANYHTSRAAFEDAVGFLPPDNLDDRIPRFAFPPSLEAMIAEAEDRNPTLISAKYEHEAARNEIDTAKSDRMPQLSAFASYDKEIDPQPGIVDDTSQATIGLRARLALYQGGLVQSRVRQAKSAAQRREFELDDMRQNIRDQVNKNWRALESARAETESRNAEIKAAQFASDGVNEEARLGERTVLDVLDAEQELRNAQAALIRAKRNEYAAAYALAASLGMLNPEKMGLSQ